MCARWSRRRPKLQPWTCFGRSVAMRFGLRCGTKLRRADCRPHARTMEPPESINAGELVLRRWEPTWAEQTAAAVRDSLPEPKPFLPWAHDEYDEYDADTSRAFITMSVSKWSEGTEFNYAILTTIDD